MRPCWSGPWPILSLVSLLSSGSPRSWEDGFFFMTFSCFPSSEPSPVLFSQPGVLFSEFLMWWAPTQGGSPSVTLPDLFSDDPSKNWPLFIFLSQKIIFFPLRACIIICNLVMFTLIWLIYASSMGPRPPGVGATSARLTLHIQHLTRCQGRW